MDSGGFFYIGGKKPVMKNILGLLFVVFVAFILFMPKCEKEPRMSAHILKDSLIIINPTAVSYSDIMVISDENDYFANGKYLPARDSLVLTKKDFSYSKSNMRYIQGVQNIIIDDNTTDSSGSLKEKIKL